MPPEDFDVYLRNIMNRLATRQAPMSAVCGAEAAAPVEPSADEDQVIYILSNSETQFTRFIMYYARELFKRMATLHTHLILSCTQARSNLVDDIEPESTWEAGLHEQTQLTDDNSALHLARLAPQGPSWLARHAALAADNVPNLGDSSTRWRRPADT